MKPSWIRLIPAAILGLTFLFMWNATLYAQEDGAALYKAKCSVCHAADGSGSSPMGKQMGAPDLRSDEVQKRTDAQLIEITSGGEGNKMPAYKAKLSDSQIQQIVTHIRELAKKK